MEEGGRCDVAWLARSDRGGEREDGPGWKMRVVPIWTFRE